MQMLHQAVKRIKCGMADLALRHSYKSIIVHHDYKQRKTLDISSHITTSSLTLSLMVPVEAFERRSPCCAVSLGGFWRLPFHHREEPFL